MNHAPRTDRNVSRETANDATAASELLKALRIVAARGSITGSTILPALLVTAVAIHLLQTARPVLLPMVLGLLLAMLTWPLVRLVMRARVPRAVSSAVVVLILLGCTLGAVYALSGPAADWVRRAPIVLQTMEYKLYPLKRPIEQIKEATEAVKDATSVDKAKDPSKDSVQVELTTPGIVEKVLDAAPRALAQIGITVVALFFFLAWGEGFMQRAVGLFNDEALRGKANRVLRDVRHDVSRYLITITLINIALGAAVGVVLLLLDYPNPMLWGVIVGLLNFAPFIGALLTLLGLAIVGLVSFDTFTPVLTAVICVGLLTTIEGYFVTPAILGRRLSLDPLAILLSLVAWGWLWGPAGLLMAVPLLVCARMLWQNISREEQGPTTSADDPEPDPELKQD